MLIIDTFNILSEATHQVMDDARTRYIRAANWPAPSISFHSLLFFFYSFLIPHFPFSST